jgi:hypothetical protein
MITKSQAHKDFDLISRKFTLISQELTINSQADTFQQLPPKIHTKKDLLKSKVFSILNN